MRKAFYCLSVAVLGLMFSALVPNARATELDFTCGGGLCGNSNVVVSGSNYSSSGINMMTLGSAPSGWSVLTWNFVFDTAGSGNISLTSGSEVISGVIQSFGPVNGLNNASSLTLAVVWNILPSDLQTFFSGATIADDVTTVVKFNLKDVSGPIDSGSVAMFPSFPTPEPASMILLGSGFLTVGAFFRKKLGSQV